MTITERVENDFKQAMKSKDELGLSVMRMVRTALKNKQIDLMRDLKEEDSQAVLRTMIKQYQDALADFTKAGRADLAERQQKEIDLIQQYLPAAMPAAELESVVREAVKGMNKTEMGKAMGAAMKAVAGRADGNQVKAIVERILSE